MEAPRTRTFQDLMSVASKNTAAKQAALAAETKEREAKEKKRREDDERKDRERLRLEKERIARVRAEDAAREARVQAEREQRIQQRRLDAEAATTTASASATSSRAAKSAGSSIASTSRRTGGSTSHGSRSGTASSGPPLDPEEQRKVDREEKLARARAKLFGEDPRSVKARPRSSAGGPRKPVFPTIGKGKNKIMLFTAPTGSKPFASSSNPNLSARARINQSFMAGDTGMTALNQVKRDRRTIEEVERDIKFNKLCAQGYSEAVAKEMVSGVKKANGEDGEHGMFWDPRAKKVEEMKRKKREAMEAAKAAKEAEESGSGSGSGSKDPKTGKATPAAANKGKGKAVPATTTAGGAKRKADPLPSPSTVTNKKPKPAPRGSLPLPKFTTTTGAAPRRRAPSPSPSNSSEGSFVDDMEEDPNDMRNEIWKIMGKDRAAYAARSRALEEEDDSDMEAGAADLLLEEGRAAKLARLEDQREQEALRRHELEKKKRKAAARD